MEKWPTSIRKSYWILFYIFSLRCFLKSHFGSGLVSPQFCFNLLSQWVYLIGAMERKIISCAQIYGKWITFWWNSSFSGEKEVNLKKLWTQSLWAHVALQSISRWSYEATKTENSRCEPLGRGNMRVCVKHCNARTYKAPGSLLNLSFVYVTTSVALKKANLRTQK